MGFSFLDGAFEKTRSPYGGREGGNERGEGRGRVNVPIPMRMRPKTRIAKLDPTLTATAPYSVEKEERAVSGGGGGWSWLFFDGPEREVPAVLTSARTAAALTAVPLFPHLSTALPAIKLAPNPPTVYALVMAPNSASEISRQEGKAGPEGKRKGTGRAGAVREHWRDEASELREAMW